MNTRRKLLIALGASGLAAPFDSFAQQQPKKPYRIGFLLAGTAASDSDRLEALRADLRNRGYVEGKNLVMEFRWAEGKYERLPDLASELSSSKINVLLTSGTPGTLAAKRATTTIPIVTVVGDGVAGGIMTNLAHPTGNVTGTTYNSLDLYAKRLQLLKDILPRTKQFGALVNPNNAASERIFRALQNAAKVLNVEVQRFEARGPSEFEAMFSAIASKGVRAVVVQEEGVFNSNRIMIADFARKQRVSTIGAKEFAEAGGMLGYGPNLLVMFARLAYFVDRILKGTKVRDLPVEQAVILEMVINLKTAKALNVVMPPTVLVRADRVIE